MSTERQKAANKANAQKSTGPRTEEGKAKSSLNHLSHGFASAATIIPGEYPEEFKALLDSLIVRHQPADVMEQILVEKIAINQWLSLRACRLQGYVFLGEKVRAGLFAVPKDLALLIRYQNSADRAFHKAHNELVKLQKERKKSEIGFESQKTAEPAKKVQPEPPKEASLFPRTASDYKILPEFTYSTPQDAAAAARIARVA